MTIKLPGGFARLTVALWIDAVARMLSLAARGKQDPVIKLLNGSTSKENRLIGGYFSYFI